MRHFGAEGSQGGKRCMVLPAHEVVRSQTERSEREGEKVELRKVLLSL
jgi:hypothetical protein